ncbi:biotin/lipoyl-containing protein, partial [Glaesserella sp.]|uniref:biotin/lipoyl-containing protein n=1 Tax=Glaesserella sp. TaxID=2094731 RepID=UPI0035A0B5F9
MTIEILVPDLPESVADATVATWHKKAGDTVKRDEVIVEIETDKVVLEVPATSDGVIAEILQEEGATVVSKQILGLLSTAQAGDFSKATITPANEATPADRQTASLEPDNSAADVLSPGVRRLLAEHGLNANEIKGSGVGGRLT